jgi:hypothetical protein
MKYTNRNIILDLEKILFLSCLRKTDVGEINGQIKIVFIGCARLVIYTAYVKTFRIPCPE